MRNMVVALTIVALLPFDGIVPSLHANSAEEQSICRSAYSKEAMRACRIVNELGTGRHVEATLIRGERIRGEIRQIADDYFVVILHGTVTPLSIAYVHVRTLRPLGPQPTVSARRRWIRIAYGVFLGAMYVVHIVDCSKGKAC